MASSAVSADLLAALEKAGGKAEIVGGEIVLMSPASGPHGSAAGSLFASLREYARRTGRGRAYPDNVGFLVDLPHRSSFAPDASFYEGPVPVRGFLPRAPLLAAEVRSEADYGPGAEQRLAHKREDYFAAGTRVVLDVEILEEGWVAVHRPGALPARFARGEIVVVEPELPGWRFPVDELFE
jgi:Uma2 family endonuclease